MRASVKSFHLLIQTGKNHFPVGVSAQVAEPRSQKETADFLKLAFNQRPFLRIIAADQ